MPGLNLKGDYLIIYFLKFSYYLFKITYEFTTDFSVA